MVDRLPSQEKQMGSDQIIEEVVLDQQLGIKITSREFNFPV